LRVKEKAILKTYEATDGFESKKGELLYTGNKVEILEGEQDAINKLGVTLHAFRNN